MQDKIREFFRIYSSRGIQGCYYIIDFIQKNVTKKPIIYDIEFILDNIINKRYSLSRFGDGELNLIHGVDIDFQKYDPKLAKRLNEILKSNKENILIALPDVFDSLEKYEEVDRRYWTRQLAMRRAKWYKSIDKNNKYCNAFISRPYIMYKDKSNCIKKFNMIKKIWDKKDIVIIEGEKSRLGVGNDLFNNCKSIKRIICPAENSYSKYDEILNYTKLNIVNELVLIALGPTASVLAYDLNEAKIQAIDIGHIDIEYEWFLNKCKTKQKVHGKYTNECMHTIVENICDELYQNQIYKVII